MTENRRGGPPVQQPNGHAANGHAANGHAEEKRKSIDGGLYTKSEFFTFFKGYSEWDAAAATPRAEKPPPPPPKPVAPEKRASADGVRYTKAEFFAFFDSKVAQALWDAAAPARATGRPD